MSFGISDASVCQLILFQHQSWELSQALMDDVELLYPFMSHFTSSAVRHMHIPDLHPPFCLQTSSFHQLSGTSERRKHPSNYRAAKRSLFKTIDILLLQWLDQNAAAKCSLNFKVKWVVCVRTCVCVRFKNANLNLHLGHFWDIWILWVQYELIFTPCLATFGSWIFTELHPDTWMSFYLCS